jgi:hypothetical protein
MFNKNDPVADSVKKIMEQNELARQVEKALCEELGVYSRREIPHEHQANYDALLEQRLNEVLDSSEKKAKYKEKAEKSFKDNFGKSDKKFAHTVSKRLDGLSRLGRKLEEEEEELDEEQLDELKGIKKDKEAAKKYIKGASHSVATLSAATGRYAERSNKEEADRKKTGDSSNYRQGRKDNETADKFFNKSWRRRKYISKAVDKLEEEQIDEAGGPKLSHYVDKAKKSKSRAKEDKEYWDSHNDNSAPEQKTIDKRTKGIDLAMRKLTGRAKVTATEEVQDGKNPLPPASSKERIQNNLGTGSKSTFTSDRGGNEGPSASDRESLNKKIEKIMEAAKSKAQQKAAGAALATQRGENDRGVKGGAVNRMALMKASDLVKIAKTKHKGLPEKKKD